MLCQKCNHNQANTIISQTINGYKSEIYLCSQCAKESKYLMDKKFNEFDGFFSGFPFGSLMSGIIKPVLDTSRRCPQCGSSFEEISESGKIGCAMCYEAFENELSETILKLHGKASHIGKAPGRLSIYPVEEESKKVEIIEDTDKRKLAFDLKQKLKTAIEEQDFEMAAQYRDQIKAIETES